MYNSGVKSIVTLLALLGLAGFAWLSNSTNVSFTLEPQPSRIDEISDNAAATAPVSVNSDIKDPKAANETKPIPPQPSKPPRGLSNSELFTLADDKYADGNVPLGDYQYTTSNPKKRKILEYLLRT